ncbi:MAG: 2,3-bisphosphoglycerate-independent phosphoglycerate mutase [Alphaproteobacteria bacterium]|nr:2,3-bisphosphoglycerate-independent phosphoglycerate mutase [Alphaproteobacteria bacterium]
MKRPKPVVLCILDGWGESTEREHNAIMQAATPVWDSLRTQYPYGVINASEEHVGLPEGQMGNSEVGHMNIGAGRIVMQDLPRIDQAIADGSLAKDVQLAQFIAALKQSGGSCHLMGLMSDGGVHAHQHHIAALANIVAAAGVPVIIHAFMDGRDTPPQSAVSYVNRFLNDISGAANIRFGTASGRYFAMDRDKRWDRVSKAYNAIALGTGSEAGNVLEAIENSYALDIHDEFINPAVIGDYKGMKDGDGLLMANFRADRAREILHALIDPKFNGFARLAPITFAATLGMVEYSDALKPMIPALFPPQTLANNFGELIANAGMKQLRIAETEKYAHVTFFFSGGREEPFAGEERILVPSPKVSTYDEQPEMSAYEVTNQLVDAINSEKFDVIIVNYANTDMVGHTGDIEAAKKAVNAVDTCVGKLIAAVEAKGGAMIITADHGNAECMHDDEGGQPHTAHTLNLVPFVVVGTMFKHQHIDLPEGRLCDVAPSLLALLGLAQPAEMTGRNLIGTFHVQAA